MTSIWGISSGHLKEAPCVDLLPTRKTPKESGSRVRGTTGVTPSNHHSVLGDDDGLHLPRFQKHWLGIFRDGGDVRSD